MNKVMEEFHHYIHPINNSKTDYDALMHHIADARIVLLGESTHGTHEFYEARAQITKRLIQEKGFTILTFEADWPDMHRVDRYINDQITKIRTLINERNTTYRQNMAPLNMHNKIIIVVDDG